MIGNYVILNCVISCVFVATIPEYSGIVEQTHGSMSEMPQFRSYGKNREILPVGIMNRACATIQHNSARSTSQTVNLAALTGEKSA